MKSRELILEKLRLMAGKIKNEPFPLDKVEEAHKMLSKGLYFHAAYDAVADIAYLVANPPGGKLDIEALKDTLIRLIEEIKSARERAKNKEKAAFLNTQKLFKPEDAFAMIVAKLQASMFSGYEDGYSRVLREISKLTLH